MILKRFYDSKLAQASYLVGCAKTGEAAVIDPSRSVQQYIEAAAEEGLSIVAVTETHIHADFLSGSRELGQRTGARVFLSDEGDDLWKYGFAGDGNVQLVKDGDSIRIGNVRLDVMHTPGHTPEHISFVLTDEPASSEPVGVFTGDFMFVGDVGRPDLLERAAGFEGTMEKGARVLYASLQKFCSALSDNVLIWPAHGSGSACGKSLGGVPVSTLGYEKMTNAGLQPKSEEDFVAYILAGQPEPPLYFKEMKMRNKFGPALLGSENLPARLSGRLVFQAIENGATLLDLRPAGQAGLGYIPGSINIPLAKSLTDWAGWLLAYDQPIYLIASQEASVLEACTALRSIGLDLVAGWFGADALSAYGSRFPLEKITVAGFERLDDDVTILDVRGRGEVAAGAIPGSINIHLGHLQNRSADIPKDKPIVVHCQAGGRSPIAVTVLRKLGFKNVEDFKPGYGGWKAAQVSVEA